MTLLGLRFESASAFIDMQVDGSGSLDVLIQTPSSPVVELHSDERATVATTIHERIRGVAADTANALGESGAELDVDDGAWKFTHRLFVPFLIATGTVVGDVVTSRPLVSRDSADVSSQARFQRSSSGAEAGTLRSVLCPS